MHLYTCFTTTQVNLTLFLAALGSIALICLGAEVWAQAKFRRYLAEQKASEE
ncbi:hypothetical protein AA0488_0660 [Kozakia baliensis NRIC 0488]|nr:hypothetical protein AA0488_0660 [Kozakia baliensis NRIC 0488]